MILKLFRALSEEEGYSTRGDPEIRYNSDDGGCEKALKCRSSSLSYHLLPPGGEDIICDSEEAKNDINMTDEERNILNRWTGNVENGSESLGTEREAQQAACQPDSGCHTSGGVCAAAFEDDDDGEEDKQRLRKESERSDADEASKTSRSSAESLITPAQSGSEAGEQHGSTGKPALEQSAEHLCGENTNEQKSGAEEESRNKEIKVSHDHPPSPKDTSLNIYITPANMATSPPPGSTISRTTYSPGSPADKHTQLPALFSGLRVLRKGVLGPEHDSVAPLRCSSQRSDGEILPETGGVAKGSILDQISNFLSRERKSEENEEEEEMEEDDEGREVQNDEDAPEAPSEPGKSVSSAEAAFDAFKAFFTPKPLKKDPGDKVDLEAVRKRIKAERDALRALFEKTPIKGSEQRDPTEQVGMTCYGTRHTFNSSVSIQAGNFNVLLLHTPIIDVCFLVLKQSI